MNTALSSHLGALIGAARLPTAEVERRAGVPIGTIQRRIADGTCGPREVVRVHRGLDLPVSLDTLFPGGPLDAVRFLCASDGQVEVYDLDDLPALLAQDGHATAEEAPGLAVRLRAEEGALLERAASWGLWGVRMAVAWVLR